MELWNGALGSTLMVIGLLASVGWGRLAELLVLSG